MYKLHFLLFNFYTYICFVAHMKVYEIVYEKYLKHMQRA